MTNQESFSIVVAIFAGTEDLDQLLRAMENEAFMETFPDFRILVEKNNGTFVASLGLAKSCRGSKEHIALIREFLV